MTGAEADLGAARCAFPAEDDFADAAPAPHAEIDARWMGVALALARRGLGATAPNPSVGAVLVRPDGEGGRVVGRGSTQAGGRPHAETVALGEAREAARGATLYVTLEPCSHFGRTPPCADAAIAAGVARVVAAMADPDPRVDGRGLRRLREAGIEVALSVGAEEARRLNAGHVARVTLDRPHVALKLAISADGKAGLAGRRPVAITGEASRARVHMMRAEADAILVGIGTVLADDPELTCRLPGMAARSPIRLILDTSLQLPPDSRLASTSSKVPTWAVAATDAPEAAERALRKAGVEILRVDQDGAGRPPLAAVLKLLAVRGVTRLMVEGGPTVAAAFLREGLVDETVLIAGPATLGPDAIDALDGLPLAALTQSPVFQKIAEERIGEDAWARYERR